jgi:hypothetical protein
MAFDLWLHLFLYFGISWKILLFSVKIFICAEKVCDFREKIWYHWKIFHVRKIFVILWKKCDMSENFFGMCGKFFWAFQSKSAPRRLPRPPPPQLSDASYGAVYLRRGRDWKTVGNNWRLVLLFFSCPWLCLPTTIHSFYPWGETVLLGHLNIDVYTLQQTSNRQRSFWFSTTLL